MERLLADPGTLAAAVRLLLDRHFTPVLAELIRPAVDLDVPALDLAGSGGTAQAGRQPAVDVMYISWHHRQVFKGAIQPSNAAR